ncbi:MAG: hypothetical protein KGH69_00235 [Candidatus Micrarchaeota archaeon]|nr:hypothetical protein [Candidatus Micrarchaeota archaeon]
MLRIVGSREITEILMFFVIVQFVGLLLVMMNVGFSTLGTIRAGISSDQSTYLSYLFDAILVLIFAFVIIRRHRHHYTSMDGNRLFLVMEVVVITLTSYFTFMFIFALFLPASSYLYYALSLGCAVLLILLKERTLFFRNAATTVSSIGVGLFLAMYLGFLYTLALLFVVAIYDYFSVFVSKSMIKLAKAIDKRNVAFLIKVESVRDLPPGSFSKKELKEYLSYIHSNHEDKNPIFKKILEEGDVPVVSRLELGEGDLDLPLMVVASSFLTYTNPFVSVTIVAGATIGLLATLLIMKAYQRPMPAIPPLFASIAITTGLVSLRSGYHSITMNLGLVALGIAVMLVVLIRVFRDGSKDRKRPQTQ